jgi:NAD(P)-dependent dehydrogenase (short-subunit alcohol dehydrogenase family)
MGQLTGKTALVAGGTTGIGLATARRFAAEGAHVFITGRRQAQLDEAVASIGSAATGICGDITVSADLDRVYEAVTARGEGLDVLFANAGAAEARALPDVTREHVDDIFDGNVVGIIFTVQKALAVLNPGSSVILAGSNTAAKGIPGLGVYSAAKAAIRSLSRTWAAELVERGIRVNTLVPGPTRTPGMERLAPDAESIPAMVEGMAELVPLGRVAQPEEIASAALFLASDESSFMTGAELLADGGHTQL